MLNRWNAPGQRALCWLVLLAAIGLPRLAVLGALPSTDEGVYAYFSQIMFSSLSSGHGLPDTGTLMLYPMMVSWVFDLPFNHVMSLRLADLVVTLIAGALFYRLVERESRSAAGAALISFVFLFTMNQPMFVQSGFKNSIFAAYIPLLIAALWARRENTSMASWLAIGALCSVAILLRETFIPFLVIAAPAVLIARGWKAFIAFSAGAALAGLIIIGAAFLGRGGVHAFIDAYINAGDFYASMKDQITPLFIANGSLSAREASVALSLSLIAVFAIALHGIYRKKTSALKTFLFWASIAVVPLLEPLSKIGFPYHFAVCLPGLAMLCALAWGQVLSNRPTAVKAAVAVTIFAGCTPWLLPQTKALSSAWAFNADNLKSIGSNTWRPEVVEQSNYLLAAEAIVKAAPAHGTLSVSGFMFPLFPLTGLLPPAYESSHLNAVAIKTGLDEQAFKKALESCPPDVLMTTTRTELPGSEIVSRVIESSALYTAVATIPIAPAKSYGTFGGTVYKRTGPVDRPCAPQAY
jgi:hypothetical protein